MKLVRFTALWCADCIVMRPRWEKTFNDRSDIIIEDFDFDDHEEEAKKYRITRVPQLIVLDEENVEHVRLVGMQDQDSIDDLVKKYFNNK